MTDYFANLNRQGSNLILLIKHFSESSWVPLLALRCRRGRGPLKFLRLKLIHPGFEVWLEKVPAELIKNGDTFDIMRLDGLDPMIGKNWKLYISLNAQHLIIFKFGQWLFQLGTMQLHLQISLTFLNLKITFTFLPLKITFISLRL